MKRIWTYFIIPLCILVVLPVFTEGQSPKNDARYRALMEKSTLAKQEAVRVAQEKGWPIRVDLPNGGMRELQKLEDGMPQYLQTNNVNAAHSTRTDSVNALIGGGNGFVIGIWDGGRVRETHQEFTPRASTPGEDFNPVANHATHVAGTMVASGVRAQAKGMAYEAGLWSFDWNNDIAEMTLRAAMGLTLSNHSYSYIRGWDYDYDSGDWYWYGRTLVSTTEDYRFGRYDDTSVDVDQLVVDYPYYLPVFSAGNDRGDGPAPGTGHYFENPATHLWEWSTDVRDIDGAPDGYDCISNGYQTAKNVLTVGSVHDVADYTGPEDVVMTTYSAWGPTDDRRIKPDVVGNGQYLYSPIAWTQATGYQDTLYTGDYYGTSMAAPNVTGSLALLQQYYHDQNATYMKAATLKGLAIHTAREAGPFPGPDPMFGWGLLDTYAAYWQINQNSNFDGKLIEELTLNDGETLEFDLYSDGSSDIKVTICWTDPPGTPPLSTIDPPDHMLVNNLDMIVSHYGGLDYFPWVLSGIDAAPAAHGYNNTDNVEHVLVESPEAGFYTITIDHSGSLDGGSQDFAMIVSGATRTNVWHVYDDGSGDAPTIAAAVDSAIGGDYVVAHAGIFYEHDIEVNEELTIIGFEGTPAVIVDAQNLGRCFNFTHSFLPVTLEGFVLRNGLVSGTADAGVGGGVFCRTNIDIVSCIIRDCEASEAGGGVYCDAGSYVTIFGSLIQDNTAGLYGGGVLVDDAGMASFESSLIIGNTATTYDGGGICAWDTYVTIDACRIHDNTAGGDGGGINSGVATTVEATEVSLRGNSAGDQGGGVFYYALMTLENCTIVENSAGNEGAGMYIVNGGTGSTTETIVAFNLNGYGIFTMSSSMNISCSDVYGNEDGNYGGNLPDQTGSNDNISEDPLFCDFAGGGNLLIANVSPCAPAHSPCGELIGYYNVGCTAAPDLVITEVEIPEDHPVVGTTISMTVTVKNVGNVAAENFYIDYYEDLASVPTAGQIGDQRLLVPSLAAGDSVEWSAGPIAGLCFGPWDSYFQVDTEEAVAELDENNNTSGPHDIYWVIANKTGWSVSSGGDFHSSPAIVSIDDDASTKEVVIGCDDGYLYAWEHDGDAVPGWPVNVGDSLLSSPAVGDITGDHHMEIVVGCVDGYLYAYDHQGNQLWSHNAGQPVYTTPALADIDNDSKLEIIYAVDNSKGAKISALEGADGLTFPGSWPVVLAGPGTTSPAVGDVDNDNHLEIAVVSSVPTGHTPYSEVYLFNSDGSSFSVNWPVTIDTVIVAPPVIGDIKSTPGSTLEIVVGGLDGVVYSIDTGGLVWSALPRVPGMIEASPALVNYDKDEYLEIVVGSRYWYEYSPPFGRWYGNVTLIDDKGLIVSGWPNTLGSSISGFEIPSPIAFGDKIIEGSPTGYIYGWDQDGATADGFTHYVAGTPFSSAAAGDLDGDGYLEIVQGTSFNAVYCLDMSCSADYRVRVDQDWTMFRHDPARTGCYSSDTATGVEDEQEAAPARTALRSVYPNPFNPTTTISFDLGGTVDVNITVYDIAGRRVAELQNGIMTVGRHEVVWHGLTDGGHTAASGVYFCRLVAGGVVQTRKMILLK